MEDALWRSGGIWVIIVFASGPINDTAVSISATAKVILLEL